MRSLLLVAMLLQSIALAGPAQPAAAPVTSGACSTAAICCCVGQAGPDRCAPAWRTAVCMCGPIASDDGPEAPLPRNDTPRAPLLALLPTSIAVKLSEPTRYSLLAARAPKPGTSHNETQALLCVWRT